MLWILAALLAAGLAVPPAARAQSAPRTSPGVTHVANFPYEPRWDATGSLGTDLELATLTVAGPSAPADVRVPVARPRRKSRSRRLAAAHRAYARCARRARRLSARRRRSALRRCRQARRRAERRARRSSADVDPRRPGVQKTFAFAGSFTNGLQVFDVSRPEDVRPVASYDCAIAQGDVQVFTRPDLGNRTFVAYAADDGYAYEPDSRCFVEADALGHDATGAEGQGTFLIEVTDPASPRTVAFVAFERGSHNQTVHPSGRWLYNSNSEGPRTAPGIEVVDITDIGRPQEAAVLPLPVRPGLGSDSHDIWFNPEGTRAYSAAVSQGVIIDTEDPAAPRVIASVFDPAVNIWHQAETVHAEVPGRGPRTVLVAADELGGGTGTGQCPTGALHFYDVTGSLERSPVKLGTWNIDEVRTTEDGFGGTCTAHVFQIHRDAGIMLIGWYNAGVRIVDVSRVGALAVGRHGDGFAELGFARFPEGSVWAAKAPAASRDAPFHFYASDQVRGLDVWRFDPRAARN